MRSMLVLALLTSLARAETLDQAVRSYLAEEPPVEGWKITGRLGLTVTDGNSDTITFTAGLDAVRDWEPWKVVVTESSLYSEDDGDQTANEHILTIRLERKISERGALFMQTLLEYDEQEDLDLRLVLTLGYKHQLVKKEDFNLWGELGGGVIHEEFSALSETAGTAHVAVNWEWKLSEQLTYTQSFLLLPNLSEGGEFLFIAESVLTNPINERLDLRLSLTDRYNSDPVAGNEENDLQVTLTIAIKLTKG